MWLKRKTAPPAEAEPADAAGPGGRDAEFAGGDWAPDPVCLLHVGKTGGTYLKSVVRANLAAGQNRVALMKHRYTMRDVRQIFGPEARAAFVFRDPGARFVSSFYSRQRQGRPQYTSIWSPEEATVFAFFRTPDALARALASDDQTEQSMAQFALKHVSHLAKNYAYVFGTPEAFEKRAHKVAACIELRDLDANLGWFLDRIGLANATVPEAAPRHENPAKLPGLSPEGAAILREVWADEFALYARMQALAAELRGA